jgi:hypothetical protein
MAVELRKFLDQTGVSTLWGKVAAELKKEADRAKAAEAANAAAAKKAQDEVDALETYVGTIPADYTETSIVAFIQKRAQETLAAAQGNSSETAASVAQALADYKTLNDPKVNKNTEDIAAIVADYLKAADKNELAEDIKENADEILRIDAALKAAVENDGAGLDSIKELATWIEEHGEDAAGYAAAIQALEGLVGDETVAKQIADAIAAENLAQYALASDLATTNGNLSALTAKVDTGDLTVTGAINAAINALSIGDYAKAADLTALAARVTTLEGKVATLEGNDADKETRIAAMEAKVDKWDAAEANAKAYADGLAQNYDAAGAAAQALIDAKSYTDTEVNTKIIALTTAEIESAISSAVTV